MNHFLGLPMASFGDGIVAGGITGLLCNFYTGKTTQSGRYSPLLPTLQVAHITLMGQAILQYVFPKFKYINPICLTVSLVAIGIIQFSAYKVSTYKGEIPADDTLGQLAKKVNTYGDYILQGTAFLGSALVGDVFGVTWFVCGALLGQPSGLLLGAFAAQEWKKVREIARNQRQRDWAILRQNNENDPRYRAAYIRTIERDFEAKKSVGKKIFEEFFPWCRTMPTNATYLDYVQRQRELPPGCRPTY